MIPTYNRAGTILVCLKSVLAQTFSPFEVIVVDDCSTDETVRLVESLDDPRVHYISLDKKSGAQAARNRGIMEAKGDWIAFQDSDDEWLSGKLEKQVQALEGVGYDPWTVVHTNAVWFGRPSGQRLLFEIPVVEGDNVYPLLLSGPAPMFQGMLVSRSALKRIGYLDEKVPSFQEWDTSIRLAQYCRFIYLREPLFIYHLHSGETISKNKLQDINGYQFIIQKFRDEIIRICGEETWSRHLYFQLKKCLNYGLWSEADKYFRLIEKKTRQYTFYRLLRHLHLKPNLAELVGFRFE